MRVPEINENMRKQQIRPEVNQNMGHGYQIFSESGLAPHLACWYGQMHIAL